MNSRADSIAKSLEQIRNNLISVNESIDSLKLSTKIKSSGKAGSQLTNIKKRTENLNKSLVNMQLELEDNRDRILNELSVPAPYYRPGPLIKKDKLRDLRRIIKKLRLNIDDFRRTTNRLI